MFLAALEDGFHLFSDGGDVVHQLVLNAVPDVRFNDGKVDPQGRWYGNLAAPCGWCMTHAQPHTVPPSPS